MWFYLSRLEDNEDRERWDQADQGKGKEKFDERDRRNSNMYERGKNNYSSNKPYQVIHCR